jgi:LAO/AO transport system kinase
MTQGQAAPKVDDNEWEPPIQKVVAAKDQKIDELAAAIAKHRAWLERTGQRAIREQNRAATQFVALLRDRLLRAGLERLEREKGNLADVSRRISLRTADPYQLADELAAETLK